MTMRRTSLNTQSEVLLPSTGELTYARRRKTRGCADAGTANVLAGASADAGMGTAKAPAVTNAREANVPTYAATKWMQHRLHRYVLYVFHVR